jgi:predicted aspartyl protease
MVTCMTSHVPRRRPQGPAWWTSVALCAALAIPAAPAAISQESTAVQTPSVQDELAEPEPLYAAPTRADRSGRILAAVMINGAGPYRFILDTGANSSALAPSIVEELGLQPTGATQIIVHGVTGSATLPAVRIESLQAGSVVLPPSNLPVLPGPVFGGADGILGIGGLQKTRIEVDFEKDRVTISPSTGRGPHKGYLSVRAQLRDRGLLLVKGSVGKVPVKVIVDTGAERTLGNMALRMALLERARYDDELDVKVLGATDDVSSGTHFRAPKITIGQADLVDLPVTFGELHVFKIWDLEDTPALVIGMDLLGTLQRFVVDYRRREFLIRPYGLEGMQLNKCVAQRCDTRIRD